MDIKDLVTVTTEFLLASTSAVQRQQMLVECAGKNDMTGLQKLITAEPALIKHVGQDAMAQACAYGHLDIVKRLHTVGAPLDNTKFYHSIPIVAVEQYPFYCAVKNGHWHVAEWLVSNGAKAVHVQRALERMAPVAPALFRHMLATIPYVSTSEKASRGETSVGEKGIAETFDHAVEAICSGEHAGFAKILVEAGMSASTLYDVAMRKHSYTVLRELYVAGYRPHLQQRHAHEAALHQEMLDTEGAARVRSLIEAWLYAGRHVSRDEAMLAVCRAVIARDFTGTLAEYNDIPAAIFLARAGHFLRDVAPLLPRAGVALLLLTDRHGVSLAETLLVRGEIYQIFNPVIWNGRFAPARALYAVLPVHIQARVDLNVVSAAFDRYRMGGRSARFKLHPHDKGGAS